jgi:hypothetical protein
MKSLAISSLYPSELSWPVYFHLVSYEPQLLVAENGVISNDCWDIPYVTVKVDYDYVTELTMNVGLIY